MNDSNQTTAWTEALVTINGHTLTVGQSLTIRVALESMAADLTSNGLGDDEHGQTMVTGYLARIREIRGMMQS